jgi:hypothetical protein
MSIRNKTKGVKMKSKVALAVVAVLGIFFVQPAEANPGKSLVIIDAYFDSKVSAPNVVCITSKNTACNDSVVTDKKSVAHESNHGNAMVEVALKQNPNLPIIALRTTDSNNRSATKVLAPDLIDALTWVNNNSSNVGAVSVSLNISVANNTSCSPNNNGLAVRFGALTKTTGKKVDVLANESVISLINSLSQKGIPVFAATGNDVGKNNVNRNKVDWPACIDRTIAVGVNEQFYKFDANTDYFVPDVNSYKTEKQWVKDIPTSSGGFIPNTTSAATVAVAAQYILKGMPTTKVVTVNP